MQEKKRVWRIRRDAANPYEQDMVLDVGPFKTWLAADEERQRLKRTPEYRDAKLAIIADPPMPHGQGNLDGI
jgi:hypothetical protein